MDGVEGAVGIMSCVKVMELNAGFVERTRLLFGEERYVRFEQALEKEPVVSIRYNSRKMQPCVSSDVVPWAADGRYLDNRPVFTADPLFHAGCYYVQEASSMFVEQVVRKFVDAPVRALDLCAAPGGKSTHLLSLLPAGSMLVSNEPVPQRAQVLAENVTKWGNSSSVVTRNEPADFAQFRSFFDFVLVDAPCSGEGMFRKDAFAVEQWSLSNVELCARRQREILEGVWDALRPGGLLVYSTCTFNREENEDCVEWIIDELGAEPLVLDVESEWNITGSLATEGLPVYRFIPGYTAGEGLFMAVLRKNGEEAAVHPRAPRVKPAPEKIRSAASEWLAAPEFFDILVQDNTVVAMPKGHTQAMIALQQRLKVLKCSLPIAEIKNNKLIPLHALAMSNDINIKAFNAIELEKDQALAYLHREALAFADAPLGYLLVTYKGIPLGFVKNIGNRANNMYPAEWRIRKNPLEL